MIDSTDTIDLSAVDSDTLTRELGRRIRASVSACPAWCDVTHDPERLARGSYHHDGQTQDLSLDPRSITTDTTPTLHVKPALFVPAAGDSREYVEQIELRTDDETLLELTAHDAAWLAEALLQACDVVGG